MNPMNDLPCAGVIYTMKLKTATTLLLACLACGRAAEPQPTAPPPYGRQSDVYTTSGGLALEGDVLAALWPSGAGKPARWLALADVSDPASPALLGRLAIDGFPQDVALQGGHAFIVNGLDLLVVDISNPRAPALAAKLAVAEDPMQGPQGIALAGRIAYLACRRGGIRSVDIGDPRHPSIVDTLALPASFVRGVTAVNDHLYAACDARGVQVVGISADGKLRDLGSVPAPLGNVGRIRVADGRAFLAAGNLAVACLSIDKPAQPVWRGATIDRNVHSAFFGTYCHDLAQARINGENGDPDQHLVFTADGETGMLVYDVTDPAAPRYLAALADDPRAGNVDYATAIVLKSRHAILLDEPYGLRVADVSDPALPRLAGPGLALAPSEP